MLKLKYIWLLVVLSSWVASASVFVYTSSRAEAAQQQPGCYILLGPSWGARNCNDLKVVYPNFNPAANKCYFSWATGFGPSPPVDIDCNNAPAPTDTTIIYPKDQGPGNPPGKSSEAEKAQAQITNEDRLKLRNCGSGDDKEDAKNCLAENPLIKKINDFVNLFTAAVGVAIVGAIIFGGIQYSASAGDPNKVSKAKKHIINAIIAFVAYFFLYAFFQWLIPGGPW
jgi:hypothetical protein